MMYGFFKSLILMILVFWWTFQLVWQPKTVHWLSDIAVERSLIPVDSASAARDRALELSTQGGSRESDLFFTNNEVSHLVDVFYRYRITSNLLNILASIAWIFLLAFLFKKTSMKKALQLASLFLFSLVLLGITILLFFSFFFDQFHHLVFPQGNWSFPADSLLITIFPLFFWQAMVGLILVSLGVFALLFYLLNTYIEQS